MTTETFIESKRLFNFLQRIFYSTIQKLYSGWYISSWMLVFRRLCGFKLSRRGINPLLFHNSPESRNADSFPTFSVFQIYNYLLGSLSTGMFFLPITILQAVGFCSCTLSIWNMYPRKKNCCQMSCPFLLEKLSLHALLHCLPWKTIFFSLPL